MARWLGSQVVMWPGGHLARFLVASWLGGKVSRWLGGQVARWIGG